uniref:Uncharacterized protein n=1 Tax=Xiphophorus couchianus TaxID=32473 RepID=A0A3B5M7U9_9TELE
DSQPGGTESLTPSAVNHILMEFLIYFGRAVVVFYPVYLTGYLGLSISWILLCMLMFTWWQKNRRWKDVRIDSAIDLVDNEANIISSELKKSLQMASWINFTDVEKVQWVNKVLEQAWPFFGMYMEKLLRENIQPTVRISNSALKMFTFTKIHFGHKPLRITGMRAYTHEVDQREVILDMNIDYDSDVDIDADVNTAIKVGIKGLKFRGMLRVVLEPLISQVPLVGGVTFFFIRRPTLQINWTGMTNLLDSPASLSEETIIDIIASLLVLPNRMCIPLIDQLKVDQMRFPLPRGVVRVHVLEARDLVAKDTYMMGMVKGKSDPYVTLRVGNRLFKTKTIKENLHPKWNEVYEFVIHEAPGQELEMELYDEDRDKDDFLGSTDPSLLNESNAGLSCAMLAVYLDNASNLPKDQKELTVHQKHGKHNKEARVRPNIYFVKHFKLFKFRKFPQVKNVKDQEKKSVLGSLNIPLYRLYTISSMCLDQNFLLERSGPNSQIKLKVTLRILTEERPPPKIPVSSPSNVKQQNQQVKAGGNSAATATATKATATKATAASATAPRRNSFLASETSKPSNLNMRRYDSHSLLSENSIASSRFDLTDGASFPQAIRDHQGSFGEINLTVRYATMRNKLMVLVHSCRDLFPCSDSGTDSYVRIYLLPDVSWRHRKKTHVKKKTVKPVFEEKFEFDVPLEEAQTRQLDVSVKNNKMFRKKERPDIGMLTLDLSQIDLVKGTSDWYGAKFISLITCCINRKTYNNVI